MQNYQNTAAVVAVPAGEVRTACLQLSFSLLSDACYDQTKHTYVINTDATCVQVMCRREVHKTCVSRPRLGTTYYKYGIIILNVGIEKKEKGNPPLFWARRLMHTPGSLIIVYISV